MANARGGGGGGGPDDMLWARGVDYVSAWRAADEAASDFNAAAKALGIDGELVKAIPHTTAFGEAVVWIRPEGVRVIARVMAVGAQCDTLNIDGSWGLGSAAEGDGDGAGMAD
ncbi:hypothetical protein ACFWY6_42710 [Streptomyces sp. NPDC059037]|uniref:hypothetical protein n=1 Tax=Streptomyces sp. NPDC059037 TaxID=3346710 RepID=UPI00369DBDB4